jgi:hypothetical protein
MILKNVSQADLIYLINNSDLKYKSTHTRLSLPIINRIYKKMAARISFPAIKIQDDFICDGHHRFIAAMLAGYDLKVVNWSSTNATTIIDWETVSFDERDWDTPEEVHQINLRDAQYNAIPVEEILAMLE